jgi:hypothetical protein
LNGKPVRAPNAGNNRTLSATDASVSSKLWLMDCLPEVAELDRDTFPPPDLIASGLDGSVRVSRGAVEHASPRWRG